MTNQKGGLQIHQGMILDADGADICVGLNEGLLGRVNIVDFFT